MHKDKASTFNNTQDQMIIQEVEEWVKVESTNSSSLFKTMGMDNE